MTNFRKIILSTTALLALPCTIQAQDLTIEEVLVTARKRTETIQDIPETVTAISADVIERAGITSINDIGMVTTGVNLNRRQDDSPNVVMRGVGSFGNVQGVGFYVDDVQTFTGITDKLEDIERIEILKGPQGTLYGGSNIGGAIKYVLKKPDFELGGDAKISYGRFGTKSISGAINAPLVDDRFAVRITGYYDETDGFMNNLATGKNIDSKSEYGGRIAFLLKDGENFDALLSIRAINLKQDGANLYYPTTGDRDYRRNVNYNEDVFYDRKIITPTLTMNWNMDGYTLTSISSYFKMTADRLADIDFTELPSIAVSFDDKLENYSQELRLASPDDEGPLSWLVGVYGGWRSGYNTNLASIRQSILTGNPDDTAVLLEIPSAVDSNIKQYAAFASLTYHVTDAFDVTVGGRINHTNFKRENALAGLAAQKKGTPFIPKVSLSYDMDPNSMVYATFSKGFEPGGVSLVDGVPRIYNPEKTTNYEVGIKSDLFNRRLRLNAAAFYIEYKDRMFETRILEDTGVVEGIINIGDARNIGIEVDAQLIVTDELSFNFGAGYIDTKWKDNVIFFDDVVGDDVDVGGRTPPYVPKYSITVSADWKKEVVDGISFGSRIDASFVGKYYWDVPNHFSQEAHTVVNASVGLYSENWDLVVQLKNAFNEKYNNEFEANVYSGVGFDMGSRATPRIWSVSGRVRF